MKVLLTKFMVLGGLCALFSGIGNSAMAQGDGHWDRTHRQEALTAREAKQRLERLHEVYAREINRGNRAAAERAHEEANAIRERLRAHRRPRY